LGDGDASAHCAWAVQLSVMPVMTDVSNARINYTALWSATKHASHTAVGKHVPHEFAKAKCLHHDYFIEVSLLSAIRSLIVDLPARKNLSATASVAPATYGQPKHHGQIHGSLWPAQAFGMPRTSGPRSENPCCHCNLRCPKNIKLLRCQKQLLESVHPPSHTASRKDGVCTGHGGESILMSSAPYRSEVPGPQSAVPTILLQQRGQHWRLPCACLPVWTSHRAAQVPWKT